MMQRLQTLFDQLLGIHAHEAALRAEARRIFSDGNPLPEAFDLPACWRRKARIARRP